MYQPTPADRALIRQRARQYRHQLERHLAGELDDDHFRPLRLQNGWYVQRHAPMLRVAIPYGILDSRQLRALAAIARRWDRGYAHVTTRQNLQFNWIALADSADVMDALAEVDLHGIQTSGNCIRNITSDAWAGVAPDESVDPRPYAELLRQWSLLHPEFTYLPRKFKVAIVGAAEDRAACDWHDVGLRLFKSNDGTVRVRISAGGGMGRTPVIAPVLEPALPVEHLINYLEALLRVYNRYGRRDNKYKARLKILVRSEGEAFRAELAREFEAVKAQDGPMPLALLASLDRRFQRPCLDAWRHRASAPPPDSLSPAYERWLARQTVPHREPDFAGVVLSLKRAGQAPGDLTAQQMEAAADLAERYSVGELRFTHQQNVALPWVRRIDLPALWAEAKSLGLASPTAGLLTDLIACPGGDFCSLANARSLPIAAAVLERFNDPEALETIGALNLHISGCINSCGHHHSGDIGILGVDKDGQEWYQLLLGGHDGSGAQAAQPGRIVGPAFSGDEVVDAIERVIEHFLGQRHPGERFADFVARTPPADWRNLTDAVRTAARDALEPVA